MPPKPIKRKQGFKQMLRVEQKRIPISKRVRFASARNILTQSQIPT